MNNPNINPKTTVPPVRNSTSRSSRHCGTVAGLLITLALAWFALSQTTQAVSPPPDGGYPEGNTAEGDDALLNLTTGSGNTAIGFQALLRNTTGTDNTATGFLALASNTTGFENTATGVGALDANTTGSDNMANGFDVLNNNATGRSNTANGNFTLFSNTTGSNNTANGFGALTSNTIGSSNTADGVNALLNLSTGSNNIALGFNAGTALLNGNNNIEIGNAGTASDSNTIRIGTTGTQTNAYVVGISGVTVAQGVGVIVDSSGHLGTVVSSERFKDTIKPMDKASEAILALKPVTFRYKHELDPAGIAQFGLVAEQVEKVNPDLVARDAEGKAYTVRYEAVNAMLLNEFLKEHHTVQEQGATIAEFKKEIATLTATVKEQAAQIQKVSAELESNRRAQRTVVSNP